MSAGTVLRRESRIQSELGIRKRLWHREAEDAKPSSSHRDQERLDGFPAVRKIREARFDEFSAWEFHIEILLLSRGRRH